MPGRLAAVVIITVAGIFPAGVASGAEAVSRLVATVSSGGAAKLTTPTGRLVVRLRHGNYVIVVRDRSAAANFHLRGGGGFTRKTTLEFTGTATWRVYLGPGAYQYFSDRQPARRHTFNVK